MPSLRWPEGVEEGILKGIYRFKKADADLPGHEQPEIHLLGSGSIMQQVLIAQEDLARQGIAADVYSVTQL